MVVLREKRARATDSFRSLRVEKNRRFVFKAGGAK